MQCAYSVGTINRPTLKTSSHNNLIYALLITAYTWVDGKSDGQTETGMNELNQFLQDYHWQKLQQDNERSSFQTQLARDFHGKLKTIFHSYLLFL